MPQNLLVTGRTRRPVSHSVRPKAAGERLQPSAPTRRFETLAESRSWLVNLTFSLSPIQGESTPGR